MHRVAIIGLYAIFALPGFADEHWAYRPPAAPAARATLDSMASTQGMTAAPPADAATLLRRVSLDLIGLPPTPAEAEEFLRHPTDASYERVVSHLLASPRFGERWATMWLDLARFADTQGYEKDNLRTIWAYRDWVIKSFNTDLPYDRFTIQQLAGDLLPNPTLGQLTATAFHRNTLTNTEGGADGEEFRVKAVLDRVNTTWTTWMATTMACAQCHDHPSEPISQRDYYRAFAFFNNTADANRGDDGPVLTLPLEEGRETTVPVMRELPADRARTAHLFHRGNWLKPEEAVEPGVPGFLPPLPDAKPPNRLAFARWLVSGENPLIARVMVNRLWAQLFGTGLVETEETFGRNAPSPMQKPLLDWLAYHFQTDWHWSMKRVLREIVLSKTYRQSSKFNAADPENRRLARGPRFRLPAEAIRDQALAAAGLLSDKMYGPSVMPPQPEGVWQVVYNVQRWVTSHGENRYRRALYTFWRRSSPYPGLALFDAPSRETCVARRLRSDSPASALVTLNDPVYVEAAEALGHRMETEGGATEQERLRYGWKLLLVSEPSQRSLEHLRALHQQTNSYTAVASALLNLDAVLTKE